MGCKNVCMGARTGEKDTIVTENGIDIKKLEAHEELAAGATDGKNDEIVNEIEIDTNFIAEPVTIQSALRGYLARKVISPQIEKYRSEKFFDVEAHYEKIEEELETLQPSGVAHLEGGLPELEIVKPADDVPVVLKAPLKLDDGTIYSGEWDKEGNMRGIGTLLSPTGAKLSGYFKDNKLHGMGRQIEPSGHAYQGEFKNGSYDGEGQLLRKDGAKLEGNFKDGIVDGNGKEEWPDGVKYEGDYKNGMKHGHGVLVLKDGVYTGNFRKNKMHGQGRMEWNNKNTYDGT